MDNRGLCEQVAALMEGGYAHLPLDAVLTNVLESDLNRKPDWSPHSLWQVFEHMRIAQWDILRFISDPKHVSPPWPDGYWPGDEDVATLADWNQSVRQFTADLNRLKEMALDDSRDVTSQIPHAPGYTWLREFLLVGDHNSYHMGALVSLRRALGNW